MPVKVPFVPNPWFPYCTEHGAVWKFTNKEYQDMPRFNVCSDPETGFPIGTSMIVWNQSDAVYVVFYDCEDLKQGNPQQYEQFSIR